MRGRDIISGEIHSTASLIRERGLVKGVDRLLTILRGAPSLLLDLLIESHPGRNDGGTSPSQGRYPPELKGFPGGKLETHMALCVSSDGLRADSMARLTVYGTLRKRVAILSAVVTRASQRRKGLARDTITELLARCCPRGVPVRLVCENAAALNLYVSMGFVPRGTYMERVQ